MTRLLFVAVTLIAILALCAAPIAGGEGSTRPPPVVAAADSPVNYSAMFANSTPLGDGIDGTVNGPPNGSFALSLYATMFYNASCAPSVACVGPVFAAHFHLPSANATQVAESVSIPTVALLIGSYTLVLRAGDASGPIFSTSAISVVDPVNATQVYSLLQLLQTEYDVLRGVVLGPFGIAEQQTALQTFAYSLVWIFFAGWILMLIWQGIRDAIRARPHLLRTSRKRFLGAFRRLPWIATDINRSQEQLADEVDPTRKGERIWRADCCSVGQTGAWTEVEIQTHLARVHEVEHPQADRDYHRDADLAKQVAVTEAIARMPTFARRPHFGDLDLSSGGAEGGD